MSTKKGLTRNREITITVTVTRATIRIPVTLFLVPTPWKDSLSDPFIEDEALLAARFPGLRRGAKIKRVRLTSSSRECLRSNNNISMTICRNRRPIDNPASGIREQCNTSNLNPSRRRYRDELRTSPSTQICTTEGDSPRANNECAILYFGLYRYARARGGCLGEGSGKGLL